MSISLDEQETTINFGRNERIASIWTSDSTVMTRLDKIYPRFREDKIAGEVVSVEYRPDKSLVSFRSKKMKRNLTDQQKQNLVERLARGKAIKSI